MSKYSSNCQSRVPIAEVEQVVGIPWVTAFCQLVIFKVQIGILRVTANFLKVQVQIVKKYKLLVCLLPMYCLNPPLPP